MLVEDDDDVAEAMVDVLETEGYDLVRAENGERALEMLGKSSQHGALPSLILLDLTMPVMDGFQFRAAQLKDPRIAEVPVVVLSADSFTAEKALGLGVKGYLLKPLTLDRLVRSVQQHLAACA
jgi:CheY-like chemotaxis protein